MITSYLVPHERSASSSTNQQQQQQDRLVPLQFAFINTTTALQYSSQGSRSVARSHIMRNFHKRKVKSRLQQANLDGPSTSQSLLATGQVHGQSNPNSSSSRLIDVENSKIHRLDGNALQNVTYSGEECEPQHQVRHKGRRELPISNLRALPVDAHATELIYHCKLCLFHSLFISKIII
jgi:hypothetical protein